MVLGGLSAWRTARCWLRPRGLVGDGCSVVRQGRWVVRLVRGEPCIAGRRLGCQVGIGVVAASTAIGVLDLGVVVGSVRFGTRCELLGRRDEHRRQVLAELGRSGGESLTLQFEPLMLFACIPDAVTLFGI